MSSDVSVSAPECVEEAPRLSTRIQFLTDLRDRVGATRAEEELSALFWWRAVHRMKERCHGWASAKSSSDPSASGAAGGER